jgi:hypothetical protein
MRRREFIALIGGATATWPLAARAQRPTKVFRIGFLGLGTAGAWANRIEALRGGLRALGYVEGQDLVIDFRWTETSAKLGTKLYALPIRTLEDFEEAFGRAAREHVDGLFIMPTSLSPLSAHTSGQVGVEVPVAEHVRS